jgi:hypothetical protein
MAEELIGATLTEAVGVFDDAATLEQAIDDLLTAGFDRSELSLLAGEDAVVEKLGHAYAKVSELEDDTSVPRTAYTSREAIAGAEGGIVGALVYIGAVATAGAVVATGGTLAAVLASAALAGTSGGLIGVVLARFVARSHADRIQEQLDHGGLLLWVRTRDQEHERRAVQVLTKHSAHDVHTHQLPTGRT